MSEPIKLNVGCGGKIWPGFINCDFENNHSKTKPDIACDLRQLPFGDNYADEIHAIHVLEHFYSWEHEDVLKEWKRVLKPKGLLVLEMPDIEKVLNLLVAGQSTFRKLWLALYGEQTHKDPNMTHKWIFLFEILKKDLEAIGFRNIKRKEAKYHFPSRDMRVECYK